MGFWEVDNEKIINEVQKLKEFPNKEKLISCFEKRFCGGYILHFSDDFYFSQLYSVDGVDDKGIFYNSGTIKFKVSESNDEQIILLNSHNEIILDAIFNEKADQFKTKVNGYYQYYKKVKPIESNKIVDIESLSK